MKNAVKKDDNRVFYISLLIVLPMCLWAVLSSASFSKAADATLSFLTNKFGWLYLISMLLFVIFAIWLALSKYGNIKLGPDDSKPEYSS